MKTSIKKILEFIGFIDGRRYYFKEQKYIYSKSNNSLNPFTIFNEKKTIKIDDLSLNDIISIKEVIFKDLENESTNLNKYNLKPKDILNIEIIQKDFIHQKPFWRNDVIKAWCLSFNVGDTSFWLGIYDDNKVNYHISCCDDMCNYNITEFFKDSEIETMADLECQIMIVKILNHLIDNKIIKIKR